MRYPVAVARCQNGARWTSRRLLMQLALPSAKPSASSSIANNIGNSWAAYGALLRLSGQFGRTSPAARPPAQLFTRRPGGSGDRCAPLVRQLRAQTTLEPVQPVCGGSLAGEGSPGGLDQRGGTSCAPLFTADHRVGPIS